MAGLVKNIFRFGIFEADASSGELRKAGVRLRLQEQPFQVLLLLLERPGEVVTREEIRRKLWPASTFVDFDHSLNTNINKLRDALSDSATNPRFIETLAKRGYRLLVPVDLVVVPVGSNGVGSEKRIEQTVRIPSRQDPCSSSSFSLTRVEEVPVVSGGYVRALFFLIQVMYLIFYVIVLARVAAVQDLLERGVPAYGWVTVVVIASASIGIPLRLYMLSAVSFDIKNFSQKFLKIFPAILVMDEWWALSPFLLVGQIGIGLALGFTAALAYVPFAQRTLALMRQRASESVNAEE